MSPGSINQVFVLGAGASLGAREHHRRRPPLGDELACYLMCWHMANEGSWHRHCDDLWDPNFTNWLSQFVRCAQRAGSFEKALAESCFADDRRSLAKLHRLMANSFLHGSQNRFEKKKDLYDDLLAKLGFPERRDFCIVTLNYDILIEEAMARVAGQQTFRNIVQYEGPRGDACARTADAITVFKPHGSVNWFVNPNGAMGWSYGAGGERPRKTIAASEEGADYGDETVCFDRRDAIPRLEAGLDVVAAQYAPHKPTGLNYGATDRARRECLHTLRGNPSARVSMIGVSIPKEDGDDPFLDELRDVLRHHPGQSEYVNPSEAEWLRALSWAWTLKPRPHTLRGWIEDCGGSVRL